MVDEYDVRLDAFGFTWGPAKVTRLTEIRGNVVLKIATLRELLVIRVTPGGLIKIDDPIKKERSNGQ